MDPMPRPGVLSAMIENRPYHLVRELDRVLYTLRDSIDTVGVRHLLVTEHVQLSSWGHADRMLRSIAENAGLDPAGVVGPLTQAIQV